MEKIYIIPNPNDYHQQGEYLVRATSAEEAVTKLKAKLDPADYDYDKIEFNKVKELEGDIYKNNGCDC